MPAPTARVHEKVRLSWPTRVAASAIGVESCPLRRQRRRNTSAGSENRYSNAKMRLQSFFMLITVQPSFFASSYNACVKVPTLVSGRPCAGP